MTIATALTSAPAAAPDKEWPTHGLERVKACPGCGARDREHLYSGLRDRIFFCAPGEWTMYKCASCGSGYLDPRPTPETIGLAYESYYTHVKATDHAPLQFRARLMRSLANGYRNYRYGTSLYPSSKWGVIPAILSSKIRKRFEREARHLEPPLNRSRLLDLGCGDGSFIQYASHIGWEAYGADPDPLVVSSLQERGLSVRQGSVEAYHDLAGTFDVVTLSHVIEHVHDPREFLNATRLLLKPGGMIWIETPNIQSLGHFIYRQHWRGLEPPRHLCLFSWDSLETLLTNSGFTQPERIPDFSTYIRTFSASQAIREGLNPYCLPKPARLKNIRDRIPLSFKDIAVKETEFITLRCHRQ